MGNLWRNYFYYTRQDIRGLLVIAAIIAAALASCIVVRCVHDDSDSKPQDIETRPRWSCRDCRLTWHAT